MSSQRRWEETFPFQPYDQQQQGIEEALTTLEDEGFYLLEGPCGTGKTLIALTASLSAIRSPDTPFERVFVITSRKQQVQAFEDDLRAINANTSGPDFSSLTLVGKADLCPYVQSGLIDSHEIFYKCLNLRDGVRSIVDTPKAEAFSNTKQFSSPGTLAGVSQTDSERRRLSPDGIATPYPAGIPSSDDTDYCPFYAQYLEYQDEEVNVLPLSGVADANEIFETACEAGSCPHAEMKRDFEQVDVLIGNYKHVFDPTTVEAFTADVLSESTLLVVDEAHGLVPEIRSQLSFDVSYRGFDRAVDDLATVYRWVEHPNQAPKKSDIAETILKKCGFSPSDLKGAASFLRDIQAAIRDVISTRFEQQHGSRWPQQLAAGGREERSLPFQDPEEASGDILTAWAEKQSWEAEWKRTISVAKAVRAIQEAVDRYVNETTNAGEYPLKQVADVLERWFYSDHTEYFREVQFTPRKQTTQPPDDAPWRSGYRASVHVHNCIPQGEIATTLDLFGGGIIMSATLEPIDVYREVIGLEKLEKGLQPQSGQVPQAVRRGTDDDQPEDDDRNGAGSVPEPGSKSKPGSEEECERTDGGNLSAAEAMRQRRRRVKTTSFSLNFPEDNRASFAVDVPKFTWRNRWPPEENQQLREQYAQVITSVVGTTPGNVLVAMPSYAEAEWAAAILEQNPQITKPVLCDESSTDAETQSRKREFVSGDAKVLTTSLLGTLTEGVDFKGDQLKGIVVVGVPISQTGTNLATAIQTAYDVRFGKAHGFEYAFTVPAVRKARQAIGRVIRGTEDVGVRVLADERYATESGYQSVRSLLPEYEQSEFSPIDPANLHHELRKFWQSKTA